MNYRILMKILSRILFIEAGLLLLPLVTALYYGESVTPFLWTILPLLAASILLFIPGRKADNSLYAREGFVAVSLSWIAMGLFGALPDISVEVDRLQSIQGMPPDPANLPEGCKFAERCPHATEACRRAPVALRQLEGTHTCRCLLCEEVQ